MRFLFLTTLYPLTPGHDWLSSDLARALVRRGHDVEVLLLDWSGEPGRATRETIAPDHVRVVDVAPRAIRGFGPLVLRASKMLLSPAHARREMRGRIDPARYDSLVTFSPASTVEGPLRELGGIPSRLLFIFDFYPICQRELGLIPGGPIFAFAKRREERLLQSFTTLACTLPKNVDYLRAHFRIDPGQKVVWQPLWSETAPIEPLGRSEERARHDLPPDRPIAVFGGQITEGRGIELILDAARAAQANRSEVLFLFVGGGRLEGLVDERARNCPNLRRIGPMPREAYLRLLTACDLGLAPTAAGVSSFNCPTKTLDYLRAGVPALVALEPGNDYVDLLTDAGVGEGADQTDPKAFFDKAQRLATDGALKASIAPRARALFERLFDVERAADMVLAQAG